MPQATLIHPPPLDIREDAFQRLFLLFAKLHGWRTAHFRPLMDRQGRWRTPVQGDGKGFLDTVLVKEKGEGPYRVLWAELKAEDGVVTPAQQDWINALCRAGQEVYVFKPSEWAEIEEVLRR